MSEPNVLSSGPEPLELPGGVHQLCRCGRSHHYPLCDGRHGVQARKLWWRPWG